MGPKSLYSATHFAFNPPPRRSGTPGTIHVKFYLDVNGWRRNIAENFNRLSRVHQRYRQTTDRQKTVDDIYSEREREFTKMTSTSPISLEGDISLKPLTVIVIVIVSNIYIKHHIQYKTYIHCEP